MYEYINGIVSLKTLEKVALDINGIAYLIYIPFKTYEKLSEIGEMDKLYIFQKVKEDDIKLYGFKTKQEREIFIKIISISGIGPKIGLAILSSFTPYEISNMIIQDDYKLLSSVPGLGVKKAQKLIIELKDKVIEYDIVETDINVRGIKNELTLAMQSLGYNKFKIDDYITDEEILKINDSGILMKNILKKINKL